MAQLSMGDFMAKTYPDLDPTMTEFTKARDREQAKRNIADGTAKAQVVKKPSLPKVKPSVAGKTRSKSASDKLLDAFEAGTYKRPGVQEYKKTGLGLFGF